MSTTKVYTLFPTLGGFSCKTIDYHGTEYTVAATSIRQAYAVAYKDVWIDPTDKYPVGIIAIYRRTTGTTLWCGCSGHHVEGDQPDYGDGVRALRAAINAHQSVCPNLQPTLADRLRRYKEAPA